jgi:hypothetical protein
MIGITSHGAYVPLYRLNRADIGRACDMCFQGGDD